MHQTVRRQDVSNGKRKPPPRTESYQSSLWFDDSSASDKSFSTMLTGDKSASRPASERSQNNLITETVAERRRRRRRRGKTKRWEVEKGAGERKRRVGTRGGWGDGNERRQGGSEGITGLEGKVQWNKRNSRTGRWAEAARGSDGVSWCVLIRLSNPDFYTDISQTPNSFFPSNIAPRQTPKTPLERNVEGSVPFQRDTNMRSQHCDAYLRVLFFFCLCLTVDKRDQKLLFERLKATRKNHRHTSPAEHLSNRKRQAT